MMKKLLVCLPIAFALLFVTTGAGRADPFSRIENSPYTYWVPAPTPPPADVAGGPPPYAYGPPPPGYYGGPGPYGPPPGPPPPPVIILPRFFFGVHFH
jgi:hypothetical protein